MRLGIESRTPTATTSDTSHTFQRGNSSICRPSVVRGLGGGSQHIADRRLDDAHPDALRDFHFDLFIANFGHPAANSAARDDLITLLHGRDRRLMLLHALLLR